MSKAATQKRPSATQKKKPHRAPDVPEVPKRSRWALLGGYIALFGYAIYIRVAFNPSAYTDPYHSPFDADAARFYRLIELISRKFPNLPMFDSFANFPWGMKAQLPPLWAFVEASFGLLMKGITGIPVASAAGIFPVITGLLMVIPAYYAAKNLFGKEFGWPAVIAALFLPMMARNSSLGMVDHHVADIFLYMSTFALIAVAYNSYKAEKIRRADLIAAASGLAIAINMLISLSSILAVVVIGVFTLAGIAFLHAGERKILYRLVAISVGTAGLFMSALLLATPWFSYKISFSELSFFQPIMLIGISAITALISVIDGRLPIPEKRVPVALLSLFGVSAIAAMLTPGVGEHLVRGFYRSIAYYPLGRANAQLQPLFAGGFDRAHFFLSPLIYLMPVGLILVIKDALRRKQVEFNELLFVVWFAVSGSYTLLVSYNTLLFAPAAVASLALLFVYAVRSSEKFLRGFGNLASYSQAIALSVIAIYLGPQNTGETPYIAHNEVLDWMRTHLPAVSNYYDPTTKPEYGIVSTTFLGEKIVLVAQRPALATENHETALSGMIRTYRIYQSKNEEEAVALMKGARLKYVLLDAGMTPIWMGDVNRIGEAGPNPDGVARAVMDENEGLPADYLKYFEFRLYRFAGAGSERDGIEPMQHFRLIKISALGRNPVMLFELVEGVRLSITTTPNAEVKIETAILPQGSTSSAKWKLTRRAGADGEVEISLPYSTYGSGYPILVEPYTISSGGKAVKVEVGEEDILASRKLEARL